MAFDLRSDMNRCCRRLSNSKARHPSTIADCLQPPVPYTIWCGCIRGTIGSHCSAGWCASGRPTPSILLVEVRLAKLFSNVLEPALRKPVNWARSRRCSHQQSGFASGVRNCAWSSACALSGQSPNERPSWFLTPGQSPNNKKPTWFPALGQSPNMWRGLEA